MATLTDRLWSCAPAESSVLPDGVQVWAAWLDLTSEETAGLWCTLSGDERARANRFVQQPNRVRFVAARGLLRRILASCLGTTPSSIGFVYSEKGKPSLADQWARSRLQFNVAHSGHLGVFAVAPHGIVGVDVEQIRPVPDLAQLVERFFSPRERAELHKLAAEEKTAGFFRIWTRKEAWLKATGEGVTELLRSTEVCSQESAKSQEAPQSTRLRLHDLAPAPGFLGALAVAPR